VDKPRRLHRYENVSTSVRALLRDARPGERVSVLLGYRPGVKPTEAAAAYRAADEGLTVHVGYPPIVTVEGDRDSVQKALDHELTVAAVKDFQEYTTYCITPRPAGPRGRG
jgi:hypothetical protein